MISLKHLKYALAVERHGHFKRAAEECAISNSALSSAISDMEGQLGFQVFERDTKRVIVTPLGRSVLDRAQSIYLQVQDLHSLAEQLSSPMSGRFQMGMIPTIAPYLLPLILPDARQQYPDLQLLIDEDQSHTLVERVRQGELDTAMLALPYDCEGLLTLPFWDEDFYLVTHKASPLAGNDAIKSEDVDLDSLMLLKDGHCLKDHTLSVCHMAERETNVSIRGSSLSTLVHLVANNMGSTFVPAMALHQLLMQHTSLRALRLKEPGPHRQLAFIVRPNYPMFEKIESLRALIKQSLVAAPEVVSSEASI